MNHSLNTPRRVTRASMAALSASKNSPNLMASPLLTAKRTPAVKKPGASTGKRGRPKKTTMSNEESKENFYANMEIDLPASARKQLNLLNADTESKEEVKEQENLEAIEVKVKDHDETETNVKKQKIMEVPEIIFINTSGKVVMETDKNSTKSKSQTENEAKASFDETLNFSKLETKEVLPAVNEQKGFDETLNFSKLEKVTKREKEVKLFDETLNYSKLEENVDEVDRSKVAAPQNFDETLGFSKMEEKLSGGNLPSVKDNTITLENEMIDLCESPMVPEKNDVPANIDSVSEPINHEANVESFPSVQEVFVTTAATMDSASELMIHETTVDNSPSVQEISSATSAEDAYIAILLAEANNGIQESPEAIPLVESVADCDIYNSETAEETLNGTFEVNDSVFEQETVTQTPVLPQTSKVDIETIVIEDTPLKPKTPHITQRRPFKKQQALEASESLSISCAAAEKSILKRKKRSLSTGDITMNFTMQERRVKFHSPANMTVHLNEIDDRMMKSFTETSGRHQRATRRKRSLSDADYSQMMAQKVESSKKVFKSKKMPDFAAIHSKQINRMESIADNLARKQERAAYLTTPDKTKQPFSDTKKDPKSSEKNKLEIKSENISARTENVPFNIPNAKQLSHVSEEKADEVLEEHKANELTAIEQEVAPESVIIPESESDVIPESEIIPLPEVDVAPESNFVPETEVTSEPKETVEMETVEAEFDFKPKAVIAKPVIRPQAKIAPQRSVETKVQFKHKLQFAGARPKKVEGQRTPVFNFAAKTTLAALKEGKEALVKPVNLAKKMHNVTHAGSSNDGLRTELPMSSRTAMKSKPSRQEEHKTMYKANKLCSEGQKKGTMLKGVRLNKRFELQMAYRNMKKE